LHTKVSELGIGINNAFIDSLTLCDLIYNRTTFPKRPRSEFNLSRLENPYQDYTWDDLLIFLNNTETTVRTNKTAYSHINFGLLQFIYEHVSKTSFNRSIKTYLQHQGLSNTGWMLVQDLGVSQLH